MCHRHHRASTQAWRTDVGNRFHPYGTRLPQPADVLVWTDNASTISGDDSSIVRFTADWSSMTTSKAGKKFRGFASLT